MRPVNLAKVFYLVTLFINVSAYAAEKTCIFGESIDELKKNKRFKVRENVIRTFKLSRESDPVNNLLLVAVDVVRDTKTNRVYHLNRTFKDFYDGGNVIGWIEEVTNAVKDPDEDSGKVVAEISDHWIDPCYVTE